MLSRALRLSLALEIAIYVSLALYAFDASPSTAALVALAGVLALRAALIGLSYGYAWAHRSPASHLSVLSLRQALVMVLGEYAAFVVTFVFVLPFARWWMSADHLPPQSGVGARQSGTNKRPPLLLIHGYGCSRAVWWWLRPRLQAAGWTVATINLEPVYALSLIHISS